MLVDKEKTLSNKSELYDPQAAPYAIKTRCIKHVLFCVNTDNNMTVYSITYESTGIFLRRKYSVNKIFNLEL